MITSRKKFNSQMITVLFKDGSLGRYVPHYYTGACLAGDSTVYVIRDNGTTVWVKPGKSVQFIEV